MKTIKTVTNEKTNTVYRVRELTAIKDYFIIDTYKSRLDASKRECKGYYYVTSAESNKELNNALAILTKQIN